MENIVRLKEYLMQYLEDAVMEIATGELDADDVIEDLTDIGIDARIAADMVNQAIQSNT